MASLSPTEGTYQYGDQFQRHAIAVLMRAPGGVIRYRSALDPAFFGSATLRQIAETLFEHVDKHKLLPQKPTLLEELSDHLEGEDFKRAEKSVERAYREDITDAKAVLERLIDFGQQQAYVNATLRAAEEIQRGKRDVRKLFDDASIVGEDLLDIGIDYRADVKARRAYYLDPDDQAELVKTGIPHLDLLLGGGLGRGELGVILAPPKRGKTLALINIGYGGLLSINRYNVAHYSLEIHEKKVARRYDDRLMGPRGELRVSDPKRYGELLQERVNRFIRGRLFVKSYPTRTASVGKIRSHLSMLAARGFHPDVLLVDYADIMKPERRLGDMRHEQAGIYEDLRQLAGEFNCAVWTGSQTSKGALDKETVTIQDFAESFEKAAVVDAAIAFCETRDERIEGKCRLFGAALRNAEDGRTVECEVNRAEARIRSTALFTVEGSRVLMEGEKPDANLESASFTVRARKREEAQKLKDRTREKKRRNRDRITKTVT